MTGQSRQFVGDPRSAVMVQPFVETPPLCDTGIPLGPSLYAQRTELFDPWGLKHHNVVPGNIWELLGEFNAGKSTLAKILLHRLSTMQAIKEDGEPELMRSQVLTGRTEGREDEFQPVTDYLQGTIIDVSKARSINLFDFYDPDSGAGMNEVDLLDVAHNAAETAKGSRLSGFEPLVFQVAVNLMLRDCRGTPMLELLEAKLRSLRVEDVATYYNDRSDKTRKALEEALTDQPELLDQLSLSPDRPSHNVPEAEFLRDSALCAQYIGQILGGEFGEAFGGNKSWRQYATLPILTCDIGGLTEKALSTFMAIRWKWQTIHVRSGNLSYIPHINLIDEGHAPAKNLMAARFRHALLKKNRQVHTVEIVSTQFEEDITKIGDEGSEIRELSKGIANSTGGRFIGRMQLDDERRHWLSGLGISDLDIEVFPFLNTGCFAIVIANQPVRFVKVALLPSEETFIESNSATNRMMSRTSVSSSPAVQHRLAELAQAGFLLEESHETERQ